MNRFSAFILGHSYREEDRVQVSLVRMGALLAAVAGTVIGGLLGRDPDAMWLSVGNTMVAVVGLCSLWLSVRHHHQAAAMVLGMGCWVAMSLLAFQSGGIRGPAMLDYPLLLVMAGWILGLRATLGLYGMTVGAGLSLVVAESHHLVPPPYFGELPAYGVYLVAIFTLTVVFTLVSRRGYMGKLQQAQQTAADLLAREADLRKLSLAVEQSPESVLITDTAFRIEYANESCLRNLGYALDEVLGRDTGMFDAGHTPPALLRERDRALADGRSWSGELSSRRKDGSELLETILIAPLRQDGQPCTHYVEVRQDITDKRRAEARIHRLAYYDELTGLPNRTQLMERLTLWMGQAETARHHGALLLLNTDRFKMVNEVYGHQFGDRFLMDVSQRVASLLPHQGFLARVSADEFAVLMALDADPAGLLQRSLALAQAVHADLQRPVQFGVAKGLSVAVSIGLTLYPEGQKDTAVEIQRRATLALHEAKKDGGSRTVVFDHRMGDAVRSRFQVEQDLKAGVAAGQLRLYLQPQVNAGGELVAAEVLVRWQHPTQGLVPPALFIPIAEESDLIVSVGEWIVTESCRLAASQARSGFGLQLSINVSARHFQQPDFVSWFRRTLAQTGVDPSLLTLEVTESLVIHDVEAVVARMQELVSLGVQFSIDDFGTGYSSLAYLKRLPIHELKIDKGFVQDAPHQVDDAALVETILSVAHHMGLRVVAEGVETSEQAQFLHERAGGVIFQGYLYGKPEPAEEALAHWRSGSVVFYAALAG